MFRLRGRGNSRNYQINNFCNNSESQEGKKRQGEERRKGRKWRKDRKGWKGRKYRKGRKDRKGWNSREGELLWRDVQLPRLQEGVGWPIEWHHQREEIWRRGKWMCEEDLTTWEFEGGSSSEGVGW